MRRILFCVLCLVLGACTTIEPSPSESSRSARGDSLSGTITFGSAVNQRTLEVNNPKASFRLNQQVAWSASLVRPLDDTKVNIVITRSGDDTELFGYEQFITDPEATTLVNRMPLGRFLPEPGSYTMRYVTIDGEVVAEGEFELVGSN
jgi:hypothetical protein